MARQRAMRSREATGLIVALAENQHGVIAVDQLSRLGISWEAVRGRTADGWLHRLHRGVYAVGGRVPTRRGSWAAAALACGEAAVLSHGDAAALWRLGPRGEGPIHVTVPTSAGRRPRSGLRIHRSTDLRDGERTHLEGIPVTTPERTILDLATVVTRRQLERAIDEAERLRLCGADELEAIVEVHRGRQGTALLAVVLGSHQVGTTLTRSELEERFVALCRGRKLPEPHVNTRVLDLTVDFLWPEARLVAELDGRQSHDTRHAFQDDRDRDSLLAAHGYLTLRFTWWDVTRRPAVVADRVRRVLERR